MTSVSRSRLIRFASPAAPLAALSVPLNVYLPAFYVRDLGMDLAAVGSAFLLARVFDVFIDPLIGFLSDRTATRIGRRRPWMLAALVVIVLFTYLIFFRTIAPSLAVLLTSLFGLYLGYSMLAIPHLSWSAELDDDAGGSLRTQAYIAGATASGVVIGLGAPLVASAAGLPPDHPMQSVGIVIIVLAPLSVFLSLGAASERPSRATSGRILRLLPDALRNPVIRRILVADLAYSIAIGTIATLFIFYLDGVLGQPSGMIPLLMFYGAAILSSPLWGALERRIDKFKLAACASLAAALLTLGWAVIALVPATPETIGWAVFVEMTVLGFVAGNLYAVVRAWMAEHLVASGDGTASAGSHFALLSITGKLGFALATGLALNGLALGDVDPRHIVGRERVIFLVLFVGVPLVSYLTLACALYCSRQQAGRSPQSLA